MLGCGSHGRRGDYWFAASDCGSERCGFDSRLQPHRLVVQMESMMVSKTVDPGSYPGRPAKEKELIKYLHISHGT